jgi:Fic family protein
MNGFLKTVKMLLNSNMDPIITAAVVGFGFVFLHPFEDGNGRLHRYLLHHVLAKRKFSPAGLIFPVSAFMYKNQRQYDSMLESFSKCRKQRH